MEKTCSTDWGKETFVQNFGLQTGEEEWTNDPRRLREENNENVLQRHAVKEGGVNSFGTGRKPVKGPCRYHYEAPG